jgi:hypothetical protein
LGKITEVEVSKGKTVQIGDSWVRVEYRVKALIDSEEEVGIAKSHIEGLIDGWLGSVSTPKPIEKPSQAKPQKTLTEVQNAFPQDLKDLLAFSENSEAFIIKPRQFLGSENFARVVEVVKGLGGLYISKGKESHFEVPKWA